jgi:hypothetical protein
VLDRYKPILDALQQIEPSAHIAGGAVRDTLLERPIRDVDLFLYHEGLEDAARVMRSEFGFVKVGEWTSYLMFSDPAIVRLAKFEKADEEIPVCLIGLTYSGLMEDNIRRFDFGICMAAWDGKHDPLLLPEFKDDCGSQTFTLHRADDLAQFRYSMSRFRKITADRYAGWTLSVPQEFEELAKEYSFKQSWYREDNNTFPGASTQLLKPKER